MKFKLHDKVVFVRMTEESHAEWMNQCPEDPIPEIGSLGVITKVHHQCDDPGWMAYQVVFTGGLEGTFGADELEGR